MYIHLYMMQAYAMIGLGACRDETRKWSRDALKVHNGAYTLAECQSFCDANPNCQGFTSDYGRQNRFCELMADAYTATGDSDYQCWSKANLKVHVYIDIFYIYIYIYINVYKYPEPATSQPSMIQKYNPKYTKSMPKVYPEVLGKGQGSFKTFSGTARAVHV